MNKKDKKVYRCKMINGFLFDISVGLFVCGSTWQINIVGCPLGSTGTRSIVCNSALYKALKNNELRCFGRIWQLHSFQFLLSKKR